MFKETETVSIVGLHPTRDPRTPQLYKGVMQPPKQEVTVEPPPTRTPCKVREEIGAVEFNIEQRRYDLAVFP
jgi:hypothetical protein